MNVSARAASQARSGPGWSYVQTVDPNDPCGYCVQWEEQDGDPLAEARPYWPDGSTVERVYGYVHARCEAAVMAYVSERDY